MNSLVASNEVNKPQEDNFVRIESKYLVNKRYLAGIEHILSSHLEPVDSTKDFGLTKVETLYFDTLDLDFFASALKKVAKRVKLRIRKYLSAKPASFIELKAKENGISKKIRFRISDFEQQQVLNGQSLELTPRIAELNSHLSQEDLASRINTINEVINTYRPKLLVKINYDRSAFEGKGIRVTVDNNITYKFYGSYNKEFEKLIRQMIMQDYWKLGQTMCESFATDKNIIIEVKHNGSIPEWLVSYLAGVAKMSDASFSKYAWGMANTILKSLDESENTLAMRSL